MALGYVPTVRDEEQESSELDLSMELTEGTVKLDKLQQKSDEYQSQRDLTDGNDLKWVA